MFVFSVMTIKTLCISGHRYSWYPIAMQLAAGSRLNLVWCPNGHYWIIFWIASLLIKISRFSGYFNDPIPGREMGVVNLQRSPWERGCVRAFSLRIRACALVTCSRRPGNSIIGSTHMGGYPCERFSCTAISLKKEIVQKNAKNLSNEDI